LLPREGKDSDFIQIHYFFWVVIYDKCNVLFVRQESSFIQRKMCSQSPVVDFSKDSVQPGICNILDIFWSGSQKHYLIPLLQRVPHHLCSRHVGVQDSVGVPVVQNLHRITAKFWVFFVPLAQVIQVSVDTRQAIVFVFQSGY
jgi:hypothetical protein